MATRPAEAFDHDARGEARDPVDFRARATGAGGRALALQVVNMSARGLMARCEAGCAVGDRITVTLPVAGAITAQVRWSLGGRIGCEMDQAIPPASYYGLLAAMVRS